MTSVLDKPTPVGEEPCLKQRLVVVGNGMAGARTIEEREES